MKVWTPALTWRTVEEEVSIFLAVAVDLHTAVSSIAEQPAIADLVTVVGCGGVLGLGRDS